MAAGFSVFDPLTGTPAGIFVISPECLVVVPATEGRSYQV